VPQNPILGDAALYGVAGMAVRALAPHTQAHPAAILLQLLAAFGNAVGPAPSAALGRRFGSRFVADICGALKLFVNVAGIRSDAF
jgi:hypothetical protein